MAKVLIIDDDLSQLRLIEAYLAGSGHEIKTLSSAVDTLDHMAAFKPNLVFVDLMMPVTDGYAVVRSIRQHPEYNDVKIVVASAKSFTHDEVRAIELGANRYLTKPFTKQQTLDAIDAVLRTESVVSFWGVRGTYPTASSEFSTYGGNTPCVSVEVPGGGIFVFDAGTGIIRLGDHLITSGKRHKINLFISHPHWDHIHGLPFFKPAYIRGNEIAIHGSAHGDMSLREVISGQMGSIYFPVTIREFAARVYFKEMMVEDTVVDGISISTLFLNHPGNTLAYKLITPSKKSIVYMTDNELVPESMGGMDRHQRQKMLNFAENADLLIHDSSYFDDEYAQKVGWGHPPLSELVRFAAEAKVKNLCLFHHDPSHNDAKVAQKETLARTLLQAQSPETQCFAAAESSTFRL